MNVFPYLLVRTGGDSFEKFSKLLSNQSVNHVRELYEEHTKLQQQKVLLCDDMLSFMQSLEDGKQQQVIQNIRREIFNDRKVKNKQLTQAKEILDDAIASKLDDYLQKRAAHKAAVEAGEAIFDKELAANRSAFKDLIDLPSLKDGLVLSSQVLLNRIPGYIERCPDRIRKKEAQVEQSLLKYLTRIYTKTSPFSTFTNLASAATAKLESPYEMKHEEQNAIEGHIRLNNYLYSYLNTLLIHYKPIFEQFYLRLNPTLSKKPEYYQYLINFNNVESFQQIPLNPVVDLFCEMCTNNPEGMRFKDMVKTAQEYIDAETEELENYIKELIDYGLFEFNVGVSGTDPDWDIKLIEVLQPLADQNVNFVEELIGCLKQLRNLASQYADGNYTKRHELLNEAYQLFESFCFKLHEAAELPAEERVTLAERMIPKKKEEDEQPTEEAKDEAKVQEEKKSEEEEKEVFKRTSQTVFTFKPEQMFYEDTTRNMSAQVNQEDLEPILQRLQSLLKEMEVFRGHDEARIKMRDYFKQKYGAEQRVPLLTFYEDYYRDVKKPETKAEEDYKKAQQEYLAKKKESPESEIKPPEKPQQAKNETLEARKETQNNWMNEFGSQFDIRLDQDELPVALSHVKKVNQKLKLGSHLKPNSFGTFLQFFEEDGQLKAVLNASFSGFGKMMSRFLHILSPEITAALRAWNTNIIPDQTLFVENTDASYFNANLHPTLLSYEVWVPGGHNNLPASQQLAVTTYSISIINDELTLHHEPTGRKMHVIDLGFQGHMGRSELFQLLEKFTYADYLSTSPVVQGVMTPKETEKKDEVKEKETNEASKPSVHFLPRIVYEDLIILQRRRWTIPKVLIPVRDPLDSDWAYFKKINSWRLALGMPDECFVVIHLDRWGSEAVDNELLKKVGRDDYKPQYINFASPMFIKLFEKLMLKLPARLQVEEMLPNSSQFLKISGERFVTEFVAQWYEDQ